MRQRLSELLSEQTIETEVARTVNDHEKSTDAADSDEYRTTDRFVRKDSHQDVVDD